MASKSKIFVYICSVLRNKDIVGSTLPITTSDNRSQIATRASAHSAQAFRRLQWLVVSRKCVEIACAFH